jgi:hypothetical protein
MQSSTLLLMAERGEIEPFSCAIFADTGWEGKATYDWLDWLKQTCKTPIITVRASMSIFEHSMGSGFRSGYLCGVGMSLPAYTYFNGEKAITKRQCTNFFKLEPIRKETRRLLGLAPRQHAPKDCVEQVVGISLDEARRMKPSRYRMLFLSYPLVHMGMSRLDCMNWLTGNGYPIPPKSSCVGCPFHSNNEWREVAKSPVDWKQAVDLDNRIRSIEGFRGNLFLHRSCRPLEEVDFSTPEERGQGVFDFVKDDKLNLFVNNISIITPEAL